jgi:hypothetical protein
MAEPFDAQGKLKLRPPKAGTRTDRSVRVSVETEHLPSAPKAAKISRRYGMAEAIP